MTDIDALVARLDAAEAKLKEHDQVISVVGCTDPKNMEADQASREFFRGVIAVRQARDFLGLIGTFVLGGTGVVVMIAAALTQLKGG
jgi:hypothetical protein